jgi:hypothetical protein
MKFVVFEGVAALLWLSSVAASVPEARLPLPRTPTKVLMSLRAVPEPVTLATIGMCLFTLADRFRPGSRRGTGRRYPGVPVRTKATVVSLSSRAGRQAPSRPVGAGSAADRAV